MNGGQTDILEAEEAVEIADGKYLQGRRERTIAAFAGQPDDAPELGVFSAGIRVEKSNEYR
ncbi:MAG: hypothetical protein MKZ70_04905 [Opitutales bacterium]|nr:hypothetical protein [Opitutales bacterium]